MKRLIWKVRAMLTLKKLRAAADEANRTGDCQMLMELTGATTPKMARFATGNLLRVLSSDEDPDARRDARAWLLERGLLPDDLVERAD